MAISGVNKQAGVYSLVQQYMSLERGTYDRIEADQTKLTQQRSVLTDLSTKLRGLRTAIYDFRWQGQTNPVNRFTTSTNDEAVVTASADGDAADGEHTVTVQTLAKAHSIVSGEFAGKEAKSDLAGTHRFRIAQGGETFDVSVTIDEDTDQATMLRRVADRINSSGAKITATVAATHARAGRYQLLLTSKETGTAAAISAITDLDGSLAQELGLAGSTDDEKGPSANTVQAAADALFTVDGLSFVAASNRVEDALTGLTLELRSVGSEPVTVSVERDVEQIKEKVGSFIAAYNTLLTEVRNRTRGADESGENRGLFTGNSLYTNLRTRLRSLVLSPAASLQESGELSRLSQIGITSSREGVLSISDEDAFEDALETRPAEVQALFAAEEDGVAVRLVDLMDRYAGAGGLLSRETSLMRMRQRGIDERMAREEARLARREEQLTTQLGNLQAMANQLQRQQQIMNALSGNNG